MNTPTVSLFIQCLVDSMYPQVGDAMVSIFDKLGIPLEYPDAQTCCGQPAYNSGYRHEARTLAEHFINTFEHADVIVCPSGSCVHMVRHHYTELFTDDPVLRERARRVGKKTYEFTEYLVDVVGIEAVRDIASPFSGRVTYHDSCHLSRGLGIRTQPRQLLDCINGLELVEMQESDRCCGFGGTFSVKYADISSALADEKVDHILAAGGEKQVDAVVGCDVSCLMNIKGRLDARKSTVKAFHIAELIAGNTKGEQDA